MKDQSNVLNPSNRPHLSFGQISVIAPRAYGVQPLRRDEGNLLQNPNGGKPRYS